MYNIVLTKILNYNIYFILCTIIKTDELFPEFQQ